MSTAALPPPDSNRSHAVQELLDANIPNIAPWTWMSEELVRSLEGAFEASRAHVLMHLLREGRITPEQAQDTNPPQLFVSAFDLGLQIGIALQKNNEFRRMMGEQEI